MKFSGVFLLGAMAMTGPAHSPIPAIGDAMPCSATKTMIAISPSQLARGPCESRFGDATFSFATIKGDTIAYIATTDPSFATPEAIRVGSTYAAVLDSGAGKATSPFGVGGPMARLPSGWWAHLTASEPPLATDGKLDVTTPETRVWKLSKGGLR